MTSTFHLGIDVAKATLEVCLQQDTQTRRTQVPNTPAGFTRLRRWLGTDTLAAGRVYLEATGGYEQAVAQFLHAAGVTVFVINPYRVKHWAESELLRSKTDRIDAGVLAAFGQQARKLHPWQPWPPAWAELRALVRTRADLQATRQQYRTHLQAPGITPATQALYTGLLTELDRLLADVTRQIRAHMRATPDLQEVFRLLCSIKGIGEQTATTLMAECGDARQFRQGRQLVAYAGLSIRHGTSGTSRQDRPRIAKRGAGTLRQALYFPAITAMRWDPHLQAFAARLAARGLTGKQIICAVMRKLLLIVFAVLRDRTAYMAGHQPRGWDTQQQRPQAQAA